MKRLMSNIISNDEIKNSTFYKSCSVNSNFIKYFTVSGECDDSVIKTKSNDYHRVYSIYILNQEVYFCTKRINISKTNSTLYVNHLRTVVGEGELQALAVTEFSEKSIHITTKRHSIISAFPNNVERY